MERLRPDGVISDIDNTLIATYSFIESHLKRTCERLNVAPISHKKLVEYLKINPPFEEIFIFFFKDDGQKILEAYRKDAPKYNYSSTPGGPKFIELLDKLNIPEVLVSNRLRLIDERLQQAGYNPKSFEDKVSLDVPKPDQHAYDTAIERLVKMGAKREKIIIIGDHPHDYLACPDDLRNNFYAVITGLNYPKEFEALGLPTHNIVRNLDGLSKLIKQK